MNYVFGGTDAVYGHASYRHLVYLGNSMSITCYHFKYSPSETLLENLDTKVDELKELSSLKFEFWRDAFMSGDVEDIFLKHLWISTIVATSVVVGLESVWAFYCSDASTAFRSAFAFIAVVGAMSLLQHRISM